MAAPTLCLAGRHWWTDAAARCVLGFTCGPLQALRLLCPLSFSCQPSSPALLLVMPSPSPKILILSACRA
jgi:hypothetical protein